ncbi:hypothetical protein JVT61DRAFT_13593 [Boletus reticuloceps]|uniref:ABM domain-containing protein n=1 Tax=Boletus reticuloceps TaxID=495285 RepID=A0A8I2YDE3_9AGAM|nr:hypothetical protein JVT61DRAFT_13593 [Boletus reticuloceps]
MTITEFAIIVFKSPPDFSDPALQSLFQKLSTWQSECSGFPLRLFTNRDEPTEVYLVTGWTSVAAHEGWIRGERNQELLRVFGPYVDMPRIRMVYVGVNFEAMPKDAECGGMVMVVERYDGARWRETTSLVEEGRYTWSLAGRDLARDDGDVFRFVGVQADGGEVEVGRDKLTPIERWALRRVEPSLGQSSVL